MLNRFYKLSLKTKIIGTLIIVSLLAVASMYQFIRIQEDKAFRQQIDANANSIVEQIALTRKWLVAMGGVRPADSNKLKPPAVVMSEISKLGNQGNLSYKFRVISLHPMNPENTPDSFETNALYALLEGQTSVSAIVQNDNGLVYRLIKPIPLEQGCVKCHDNLKDYNVGQNYGAMSVTIPYTKTAAASQRAKYTFLAGYMIIGIIVMLVIYLLLSRLVIKPLISLKLSAGEIAAGEYSRQVEVNSRDEIGDLAWAFNKMTSQIRIDFEKIVGQKAEIEQYSRKLELHHNQLENIVQERTQELTNAIEELKQTQSHLVQQEKMVALGQLIAGVAHEISTPLGAIKASYNNISDYIQRIMEQIPRLNQLLSSEQLQIFFNLVQRSISRDINLTTREERKARRLLLSWLEENEVPNADSVVDMLADMNLFEGMDEFMPILKSESNSIILEIAYHLSGLERNTHTIGLATERAAKMVFALKSYARHDQSSELAKCKITDGIETVLTIYQNQIKQATEVIRNYEDIPPIMCYPDELNQVWTNLVHNSLQAMDYKGQLIIDVFRENDQVVVRITDSGKGIPEEIKKRIFDPFFTTKRQGEGTGLGLDIVRRIIDKHHGEIDFTSEPRRTTFTVKISAYLEDLKGDLK